MLEMKLTQLAKIFQPTISDFDQDSLISLLQKEYFNRSEMITKEEKRTHVLKVIALLGKNGFGASAYPIEHGGKSNFEAYIRTFEILAMYDLTYAVKFGVQYGLFGGSIQNLGTNYHHDYFLKAVGKAELLGCFAMTETNHGSNVKDIKTTATYHNFKKTIIINTPQYTDGKEYIGNTIHGSIAIVFAQLIVEEENQGVHAILVPYRDKEGNLLSGIKVADCGYKMGLNGIDNGRLWFDHVSVPRENLLNKYGEIDLNGNYKSSIENSNKRFFTMLGSLVGGRICVGMGAVSAARRALCTAIQYAHERKQFKAAEEGDDEVPLINYPSHQHRLMPLLVKNIMYHHAIHQLGKQYNQKNEDTIRKIEIKAAGLKAMATWICTKTIQECRESCGGKGYLSENHLADLKADSDIFTTFEGDNTVLMQLVGKGLLTEFNQAFHEDRFNAVFSYVAKKINFTFSELNIYNARKTSTAHILDPDFLAQALRYREKKMLVALVDRMRKYIDQKVSPHEAFLKCQVHLIDAANAYIERLVFRNMDECIQNVEDGPEKELLKIIQSFYALTMIMEHRYFYLETDYMDGSKTKAIRRVYSDLLQQITNHSLTIIQAFCLDERLYKINP